MPIKIESPEEYSYNLSESSVADQSLGSLGLNIPSLTILYNEHQDDSQLWKVVVPDSGLDKDDVLITGDAAGALFIIETSQLTPDDHIAVVRPNYATDHETPRAIGCHISFVDF
jgi:DNA-binding transcriptional MocR family regulator